MSKRKEDPECNSCYYWVDLSVAELGEPELLVGDASRELKEDGVCYYEPPKLVADKDGVRCLRPRTKTWDFCAAWKWREDG